MSIEENLENMEEAIANVKTAQVTYAVRDTDINDTKIKRTILLEFQRER